MSPALAEALIKILAMSPELYREARAILTKKEPTLADFDRVDAILDKTGLSYFVTT